MTGKREKPEDIVLKPWQVDVLQVQGLLVDDAVSQVGITQQFTVPLALSVLPSAGMWVWRPGRFMRSFVYRMRPRKVTVKVHLKHCRMLNAVFCNGMG
ncbi:hypothetical protein SAMN04488020_12030 [Palleronia marisminoris]|nr:hypothetical protein SAMN04488020_12030 [Palleronia marisminoris]